MSEPAPDPFGGGGGGGDGLPLQIHTPAPSSNFPVQLPSPVAEPSVTSCAGTDVSTAAQISHSSYQEQITLVTNAMVGLKEPLEELQAKRAATREQDLINDINQSVFRHQEEYE
ncbi:hypothetical protein BGZ65_000345, partial [Modicella reniformis]